MDHVLLRRQFLLRMLGTVSLGTGLLGIARAAAGGTYERSLIDRLASPSFAGRRVDRYGDGYRFIQGTGLPEHATGAFPNPNCPGPIMAQNHEFRVAAAPQIAAAPKTLDGWIFGVGINGVVFDPTGPFFYRDPQTRTSWEFEVMTSSVRPYLGLDTNNAHTQPSGEYHYHGYPTGLITGLTQARQARGEALRMLLLGWAADGFPVYAPWGPQNAADPLSPLVEMRSSYIQLAGPRYGDDSPGGRHDDRGDGLFVQDFAYRAGSGHLDDCNGRFGPTPEYPGGTYHYVVTNTFPFIPRQWRGTPDASFWHPSPGFDAVPPALQHVSL
jgi:hypothetical protein